MLLHLFTDHPEEVGESYLQHLGVAARFSGRLFLASLICLCHAVLPWTFKHAGSDMITKLHAAMSIRAINDIDAVGDLVDNG